MSTVDQKRREENASAVPARPAHVPAPPRTTVKPGQVLTAEPTIAGVHMPPPRSRGRWIAGAAVVAVLAVIIGTGVLVSEGEQTIAVEVAADGGVTLSADPAGGAQPAQFWMCSDEVLVELGAGETRTVTCVTADAGPDQTLECAGGSAALSVTASSRANSVPRTSIN